MKTSLFSKILARLIVQAITCCLLALFAADFGFSPWGYWRTVWFFFGASWVIGYVGSSWRTPQIETKT